jgi:L-aminopeptidase/D-esterase-like protein
MVRLAQSDHGSITDVTGVRVGQITERRRGWRTGTTVILVPGGAVGGVDVRGGGPGTHETDLLRPENLVHHVHAVCLTGGSAYGLAAATGVMTELEARGIGFPVGIDGSGVVPIVPAAVIYDLGRGGVFTHRPDESFGSRAVRAARIRVEQGSVGAGTGAVAGGLQGGVGTASIALPSGTVVGAIAVVNSAGSVIDPDTCLPWESRGLGLRRPGRDDRDALAAHLAAGHPPLNTTIGVVATTASLTKAECTKFAGVAHDGLARAIRPAHSLFDGDTIFALATGADVPTSVTIESTMARARAVELNSIFEAGAQCFAAACSLAIVTAQSTRGGPPAYRDLCPSAYPALRG